MTINLGEIRERAEYRARDIQNVLTSRDIWRGHINAAYFKFLNRSEFPMEIASESLVFPAGAPSADLPSGVYGVLSAQDIVNDVPLDPISTWRQLLQQFPDLDVTGRPTHFRIVSGKLFAYPKTDSPITVKIHYAVAVPELVDDSDVPIIPQRYHEALVVGAVAESHRDDQNEKSVQSYEDAFDVFVSEALSEFAKPKHGEFVPLPRAPRARMAARRR